MGSMVNLNNKLHKLKKNVINITELEGGEVASKVGYLQEIAARVCCLPS